MFSLCNKMLRFYTFSFVVTNIVNFFILFIKKLPETTTNKKRISFSKP